MPKRFAYIFKKGRGKKSRVWGSSMPGLVGKKAGSYKKGKK